MKRLSQLVQEGNRFLDNCSGRCNQAWEGHYGIEIEENLLGVAKFIPMMVSMGAVSLAEDCLTLVAKSSEYLVARPVHYVERKVFGMDDKNPGWIYS